jgi:phosphoserine phosphatase
MSIPPKSPDILALWRNAQAVCFDVDSTVCMDEGIDVLAAHAGVGEQVAELTRQAMGGNVLFQDALRLRLDVIRPSRTLLAECLRLHPPRLSPGIGELVSALVHRKVAVYLITGGFEQMVEPVIKRLDIPKTNLIANILQFDATGNYAGFDENAPTSRNGGKGAAIAALKRIFGYGPVIMVGDGITDLEARPPADGFIGYGGVVTRPRVQAGADWFVTNFQILLDEFTKTSPPRRKTSTYT